MPVSTIESPDFGTVHLRKKRGVRNMRLRVDYHGTLHITLPWLVPQGLGLAFADKHKDWIQHQQNTMRIKICDGSIVNDLYKVEIIQHKPNKILTKLDDSTIRIFVPTDADISSQEVQAKLRKKIEKIVKDEAREVLGPMLYRLAKEHGYKFSDVEIKTLKSRWGSCSSDGVITLNTFAVQLPARLQEYVILHELAHINHMHHGKEFWGELTRTCPDAKSLKKDLKGYQPTISLS